MLRFAVPGDAGALLAIYAQYIDTSITFEYTLPPEAEFRARIESISQKYPYLVHETDGVIDGYAYAHPYRERAAYQWGAELSVYVNRDAHGRGIGTRLYAALMELLKLQGVRAVYGVVTQPNEKSGRLHTSLGFTPAGTVHRAGFKAGRWHDVTTYEKLLTEGDDPPAPLADIGSVDCAAAARCLEES